MKHILKLKVNGREYEKAVSPGRTLVEFLREDLELTGTKQGCGVGECGTCTVLVNGEPVNSCLMLALEAEGKDITTIEGLQEGAELHPVQKAFIEKGAVQCGFCSPGMILSSKALLEKNPHPSVTEIRSALAGNLCRCTGYQKIIEAVSAAAEDGEGADGGQRRKEKV